jgi:hypothetical protein
MRISNVVIAISALLLCSAASAQTKYYMRQQVPNTAKAAVAPPAGTTCGLPRSGFDIGVPIRPTPRYLGGSYVSGPQAAQQWCNSSKFAGMVGACIYQEISPTSGVAALWDGYSVQSSPIPALYAAECA